MAHHVPILGMTAITVRRRFTCICIHIRIIYTNMHIYIYFCPKGLARMPFVWDEGHHLRTEHPLGLNPCRWARKGWWHKGLVAAPSRWLQLVQGKYFFLSAFPERLHDLNVEAWVGLPESAPERQSRQNNGRRPLKAAQNVMILFGGRGRRKSYLPMSFLGIFTVYEYR